VSPEARVGRAQAAALIRAARQLAAAVEPLRFGPPVAYVYNPLDYARKAHEKYLARFAPPVGGSRSPVLYLGMNPGPWGMAQTGVPFGDVSCVRDWLGIQAEVGRPAREHPRRRVLGYAIARGEVSGRRLWSLMRERFGTPQRFAREHFVANYCPLMFLDAQGRNITPDRLPASERARLLALCDAHLLQVIEALRPRWAIGIGGFAERRIRAVQADNAGRPAVAALRVAGILHPSPASPQANRGWAREAAGRLESLGVWGPS